MPMPPELKNTLLVSSREAAVALLSDLEYLDAQLQTKLNSHDVRRFAVILRRVLVERAITTVASPRMERIFLIGPNNDAYIQLTEEVRKRLPLGARCPIIFYMSGGLYVNGKKIRSQLMTVNKPSWLKVPKAENDIQELRLDNFLSQPVLYFGQTWIKRVTVIKHMALYGHGVHSLEPKTPEDKLLAIIRKSISFQDITGQKQNLRFRWGHALDSPYEHRPTDFNPVLIELVAAAHYLVQSPDVVRLRDLIRNEFEITA